MSSWVDGDWWRRGAEEKRLGLLGPPFRAPLKWKLDPCPFSLLFNWEVKRGSLGISSSFSQFEKLPFTLLVLPSLLQFLSNLESLIRKVVDRSLGIGDNKNPGEFE